MSRNGSGTYSLPAGNPVVTGTTISSTWANNTLSDIATALTQSIAYDGQTTPTANLPMGGFKHTGVAVGSALTDYARYDQLQNSSPQWLTGVAGTDTITASAAVTPSAYAAGQTFRFVSAGANTGAVTLNISSLGAKSVTKRGATALSAGEIPNGSIVEVCYDGTQFQLINVTPAVSITVSGYTQNTSKLLGRTTASSGAIEEISLSADFIFSGGILGIATISPPVRQTVLSGPVDSSGYSAFGGSTGSTTVTATGTLKATAAAGGDTNYSGSITNPSWTGLSTNGTMYLYLDITSSGVVTTGSTTLAPVYQWGGTYSTTNLQNTFNIQEMTMKVGNGSTASQVYRVFVGEVTVAANVVSAITWYALMARSVVSQAVPAASTNYSLNHNIGGNPRYLTAKAKAKTPAGLIVDVAIFSMDVTDTGTCYSGIYGVEVGSLTVKAKTGTANLCFDGVGAATGYGAASSELFFEIIRGW